MKRVPYEKLRRAEREARKRFPHATRIKALWTPGSERDVHIEVWTGTGARVLAWEPQRWA